jgi:TRAP-type C4-dicarboxylate transport system permease small subunit
MWDRLARLVERCCNLMAYAGGTILLGAAMVVAVDVTSRNLFHVPLPGASELSGYALAIGSSWAFGFTLLRRGHIRIDVAYRILPAAWRIAVDLVALVALAGFLAILVWQGAELLHYALRYSTRSNTPLGTPMAIPLGLWVFGLAQFLLVTVFLAARVVWLTANGRRLEACAVAGLGDIDGELEDLHLPATRAAEPGGVR